MPIFAQTLDLVDDPAAIAEYVALHRAVWPEVLRGLRGLGIRNMRLWRHGTRLFMVIEADDGFDPARYQAYASDPTAKAWDELMRRFQRRAPGADPADGGWWSPMEEIFDLDRQLSGLPPAP